MFAVSYLFRASDRKQVTRIKQTTLTIIVLFLITACLPKQQAIEPVIEPPQPVYSAEPILQPKKSDILFAQKALNQLGYKVGPADGIWGPRSARGITTFEAALKLTSAGGKLSELNLQKLKELTNTSPDSVNLTSNQQKLKNNRDLASLLREEKPLSEGPVLVFLERPTQIKAKTNPYSATISQLVPGNGLYVLAYKDGWYLVETENRKRGFIQKTQ